MNFLIVVDMQNDFITGSLGSKMAEAIVPEVAKKVKNFDGEIIFTRDTHSQNYLETSEGKKLPVVHCVKDTAGWEICNELKPFADKVVDKITFGSLELAQIVKDICPNPERIELCGLCTDICVISNAMILKSAFPETDITVDSKCCAGVTEESHTNALGAMKSVQINIM